MRGEKAQLRGSQIATPGPPEPVIMPYWKTIEEPAGLAYQGAALVAEVPVLRLKGRVGEKVPEDRVCFCASPKALMS